MSHIDQGLALMITEIRMRAMKLRRVASQREVLTHDEQITLASSMLAWADQLEKWEETAVEHPHRKILPFRPRVISVCHEPVHVDFTQNPEGI
jgi:hypothetical protein